MTQIEVFADVVCPFTHVGLRRLFQARLDRHSDVRVRVRAWPLEWINGAPLDSELVTREIVALRAEAAPDMFAGFNAETFPRTSIPAFALAAAAYDRDDALGESVSLAVRDALFEDGLDIGDPEVIADLAGRFDITPVPTVRAEASVRADWSRGKLRGVKGSPHFFVGSRDWFCPTLAVRHADGSFDVATAQDSSREFYAAAFS